jgi:hypothetical protein
MKVLKIAILLTTTTPIFTTKVMVIVGVEKLQLTETVPIGQVLITMIGQA